MGFSTSGGGFMFKWPEKITTSLPIFSLTSESSNKHCMCWGISVERAKSDARFDDSEAKWGHGRTILTISGHLYVILFILDKKWQKNCKPGPMGWGNWRKFESDSLKPMIWHFRPKNPRYFPHCSALCGPIFKIKVGICSNRISSMQKWPKVSEKMANECP